MTRFDPQHSPWQHRRSLLGWLLGGGGALFFFFFILFAETLPQPAEDVPAADGIVVFTGGATARIDAGLALLAEGRGGRLLVSGLHKGQSFDDILARAAVPAATLRCCLDLDYRAANTVANTRETASWAEVHGFRSLIVVTSAHHMPRAFLELRRAMPTARLSAYPVVPASVKLDYWFAYPGTMALLLGEYMRYLWALTGLPRAG